MVSRGWLRDDLKSQCTQARAAFFKHAILSVACAPTRAYEPGSRFGSRSWGIHKNCLAELWSSKFQTQTGPVRHWNNWGAWFNRLPSHLFLAPTMVFKHTKLIDPFPDNNGRYIHNYLIPIMLFFSSSYFFMIDTWLLCHCAIAE